MAMKTGATSAISTPGPPERSLRNDFRNFLMLTVLASWTCPAHLDLTCGKKSPGSCCEET
jgi:hypothetical protein